MTSSRLSELPGDIGLVDLLFLGQPGMIGTYVLPGDAPALVDPGPASTVEHLEAGLAAHDLTLGDVRALLLTHIHLDHAGATGSLLARYPDLPVYVHQVGAPHLIAPDRLLRSAHRLYGDLMERLWGQTQPVPEGNITTLCGGETLRLGGRVVRVFDTPGHAWHHVTFFDEVSGGAFVGDTAGVRVPGVPHIRPATPPPEVDIEAWLTSLDTLRSLHPSALLMTHFGPGLEPLDHIKDYRSRLLRWSEAVRRGLEAGGDESEQIDHLAALAEEELGPAGGDDLQEKYHLVSPIELSWHGLARYWRKRTENAP